MRNLPDELPELKANDTFCFACGPEQPCFNRCCAQLALPLTPYDVLRLCRNLASGSAVFLSSFCSLKNDPETGMPNFFLRMIESPDAPCPFVTPAGCSVYEDRPGACRAYPLGRGARIQSNGVRERFFMVREEHCAGFGGSQAHTPADWFAAEGFNRHIPFDDAYMRLLSLIRASGPLEERARGMAMLSLWQMDKFHEFLRKMKILERLNGPAAEDLRAKITNGAAGADMDEALLKFGLAWLELAIFGQSALLRRRI